MKREQAWREQNGQTHMPLYDKLEQYGNSDYYPYHMPGHKRKKCGSLPEQILKADITEIDGFDNLHEAAGVLRAAQETANALYGSEETFFLVNGSTAGILSAISAVVSEKGHLLIVRNSHKSVYHAAYLRHLRLSYLYPAVNEMFGFGEAVTPEAVRAALDSEPDIEAVLIVTPTYEGRIANVKEIAESVHAKGIPLIVDEAHGAHLGFAEGFAESSCTAGADIVIHSVHKTLPAMTQTALLHINGKRVDRERVKRFLRIYQTSSPSYVLMASICDAMEFLKKNAADAFAVFRRQYMQMLEDLKACRELCFPSANDIVSRVQDIGKLIIGTKTGMRGQWLYDTLRGKYHLQCEMAAGKYCLAMFTVADGAEAYERMTQALLEIDALLNESCFRSGQCQIAVSQQRTEQSLAVKQGEIRVPFCEAWDSEWNLKHFSEAVGCAVGEFINLYPPGTPILVPGEILTEELYDRIRSYQEQNLNLQGLVKKEGEDFIKVLEY